MFRNGAAACADAPDMDTGTPAASPSDVAAAVERRAAARAALAGAAERARPLPDPRPDEASPDGVDTEADWGGDEWTLPPLGVDQDPDDWPVLTGPPGPPGPKGDQGDPGTPGAPGRDAPDRIGAFLHDTATLLDACHTHDDLHHLAHRITVADWLRGDPDDPAHAALAAAHLSALTRAHLNQRLDDIHHALCAARTEQALHAALDGLGAIALEAELELREESIADRSSDLAALGAQLLAAHAPRRERRRRRAARWAHLRAAFSRNP